METARKVLVLYDCGIGTRLMSMNSLGDRERLKWLVRPGLEYLFNLLSIFRMFLIRARGGS